MNLGAQAGTTAGQPLPQLEVFATESEWLAARRVYGIGASEAWDVLLGDRWRVYLEKMGQAPPFDADPDDLEWGHDIEHAAERYYRRRWLGPGETYERLEWAIAKIPSEPVFATPDAIVFDARGRVLRVVEVKRRRWKDTAEWGEPGTDQVPERVLVQVQLQCRALDCAVAHVFGSLGDTAPQIYVVQHDPELSGDIVARLAAFWRDHVEAGVPPPLDGSASADAGLAARFPFNRIRAQLDPCGPGMPGYREVCALWRATVGLATAETTHDLARQQVQGVIGDRCGLQGEGFKITWKAGAAGRPFRANFTPAFKDSTQ